MNSMNYHPPTKLREYNVFNHFCHSVCLSTRCPHVTITHNAIGHLIIKAVADLRGAQGTRAPLGVQILSISCSFWENLAKLYFGAPRGVGAPFSGKSWIRH